MKIANLLRDDGYIQAMANKYNYCKRVLPRSHAAKEPFYKWLQRMTEKEEVSCAGMA
jgi:hypothetical protein